MHDAVDDRAPLMHRYFSVCFEFKMHYPASARFTCISLLKSFGALGRRPGFLMNYFRVCLSGRPRYRATVSEWGRSVD